MSKCWTDRYYDSLSTGERIVIGGRFFGKTRKQIAKQVGLSRSRICQIEEKALRKLRHPTRLNLMMRLTDWRPENVSDLNLLVRAANCLREGNIKTVAELVHCSDEFLFRFRNFGPKSLDDIDRALAPYGIKRYSK